MEHSIKKYLDQSINQSINQSIQLNRLKYNTIQYNMIKKKDFFWYNTIQYNII